MGIEGLMMGCFLLCMLGMFYNKSEWKRFLRRGCVKKHFTRVGAFGLEWFIV